MQSAVDSNSIFCNKYATLRFVVDPDRNVSVPVGVALWGPDPDSLKIRLPEKDERFQGADVAEAYPYLELVCSQIRSWLRKGSVPYQREPLRPLSDEWWEQVRRLLKFRVHVDEPKPIECMHPDLELEALYEAVARPRQKQHRRRTRLEATFKEAVGDRLASELGSHAAICGYHNRSVEVFKHAEVDDRHLVVEVVNLATSEAEKDADALTSRLLRIKAGPLSGCTRFVLGYIASPSGLNGEGVMKDWIEEKAGSRLYDVVNEAPQFADQISDVLHGVTGFGLFG